MLAIALLPTRAQIGPAAGWLLLLLRCVMGFSVGGEYTGVVAYLLEGAPAERRGLIASLAAAASEVGALLAVGVSALTVSVMSDGRARRVGLADPLPVRRGARVERMDRRARPCRNRPNSSASAPPARSRASPLRHALRPSSRRNRPRLRHLGARLDHLLCRDHLRPGVPDHRPGRSAKAMRLWLSTIAAVAVILVTPLTGLVVRPLGPQAGPARRCALPARSCRSRMFSADGERVVPAARCSAQSSSPASRGA